MASPLSEHGFTGHFALPPEVFWLCQPLAVSSASWGLHAEIGCLPVQIILEDRGRGALVKEAGAELARARRVSCS